MTEEEMKRIRDAMDKANLSEEERLAHRFYLKDGIPYLDEDCTIVKVLDTSIYCNKEDKDNGTT